MTKDLIEDDGFSSMICKSYHLYDLSNDEYWNLVLIYIVKRSLLPGKWLKCLSKEKQILVKFCKSSTSAPNVWAKNKVKKYILAKRNCTLGKTQKFKCVTWKWIRIKN